MLLRIYWRCNFLIESCCLNKFIEIVILKRENAGIINGLDPFMAGWVDNLDLFM